MKNEVLIINDLTDLMKNMQVIREKLHLESANFYEIEKLNELENILNESRNEFQSEFWS